MGPYGRSGGFDDDYRAVVGGPVSWSGAGFFGVRSCPGGRWLAQLYRSEAADGECGTGSGTRRATTTRVGATGEKRMASPLLEIVDLRTYFHVGDGIRRALDGISLTLRLAGDPGSTAAGEGGVALQHRQQRQGRQSTAEGQPSRQETSAGTEFGRLHRSMASYRASCGHATCPPLISISPGEYPSFSFPGCQA